MIKTYTLKNDFIEVTILNLGGIIHSIKMPDKDGNVENIIHGFKEPEDYRFNDAYFGAIIGRTAGRINKGAYSIDGNQYTMCCLDRGNGLHGGKEGFDKKYWDGIQIANKLTLTYDSPDGEEGFPGNLKVKVTYELEGDKLILDYEGVSDKDTLLNMTNHSYFNLNPNKTILDMSLQLESDYLVLIDETSIPTGKKLDVTNTPFDFRNGKLIGKDIDNNHEQLELAGGYDHPWLINGALKITSDNGREMKVVSDQECVVLYSYNFPIEGDDKYKGLAIEFQNVPDGINHENFKSSILRKNEVYKQRTVYQFKVKE